MFFKRFLIYFFSRFINYDSISYLLPVSVKSLVLDNNRVLLIKNERNEWDLPGGKIQKNESPLEALNRETKEELNITLNNSKVLCLNSYNFREQQIIVAIYISEIHGNSPIKASSEIFNYDFFTQENLKNLKLTDWSKEALNVYFNKDFSINKD